MGIKESNPVSIADALFSSVQQHVLALLFGQPDRAFQGAELIRKVGSGSGAVHRQLVKLAASGLVSVTRIGNQKYYQANPDSPVYEELCGLIRKTVGLQEPLYTVLWPFRDRIKAAFVYGSVAKGLDTAASDIDLMVISESLTYADLFMMLEEASNSLDRTVNPTIYTPNEWFTRIKQNNAFVTRVREQPKIWIVGDDLELAP